VTCLDDATVLGLVEGRLTPELIAHVDEHIDSCASCRDVVTLVAGSRSSARVLARGDNVGRYVVGDLLGAGAMGRVYSAWEPELDRRVAIKVLHEAAGRDRLVKEAQAMARLNHPNVVTVHEVGSTEAGVFVAMELVDGETLRAWVAKPREWREIVRVLVDVARGLAAVHAAGVVHRDIKPDNVIVGADGRVRLGDFGLARSGGSAGAAPSASSFALGTVSAGTSVAGTPAYMAPEVLRGSPADAASDQFSFGVLAYELLAGKRPFEGATWTDLLRAIEHHDVRAIPDVPSWLDALVQRCIAVDPARRHRSLAVVADTLADRLSRKRPISWLAAVTTVGLLASGLTWWVARERAQHADSYDEDGLAMVWDAPQRASLVQSGVTATTIAGIDRWVDAWNRERDSAREGVKHENVDHVAARRRCLLQRRDELDALLRSAAKAPDQLLDAVAALPPPNECRKADADPLPADNRAVIATEVLDKLPEARAQIALGKPAPDVQQLVARAKQSGHAPTLAEALLVEADGLRLADRGSEAALAARDAVAAAERGHADLLRARAWLTRVAIAGEQRDLADAEDLGAIAQATIDRIGAPHLAASLARLRGLIAYNRGRLDEARAFLLDARQQFLALGREIVVDAGRDAVGEMRRATAAPNPERTLDIAAVDSALGSVARAAGDLDEAERRHRSVLALDRELRGTNHRDIARDLHNIAGVLRLRGNLVDALATYREALAVEVATQGERSIAAALTHNSIGLVELERKDFAAANTDFELARELLTAANHGDRAFAEHNLGLVAQAQGKHAAALAHFNAAAEIYKATIGLTAPAAARLVDDRARSEALISRAVAKPKPPPKPPQVAQPQGSPKPEPPKPVPAKPEPKRDVGVYGSAQSW
jgi:eukaryotic-like serine/threonine-protein kinase